jgi:hypothetical protein
MEILTIRYQGARKNVSLFREKLGVEESGDRIYRPAYLFHHELDDTKNKDAI